MVCLVKVVDTGRFVPACDTQVFEGMVIESETPEVQDLRRNALELLLGDHLGDCHAPCRLVHPEYLDLPRMIHLIAEGKFQEAGAIAAQHVPADSDKAPPWEKACRRGRFDKPVAIDRLIRFAAGQNGADASTDTLDAKPWTVTMGALNDEEKAQYIRNASDRDQVRPAAGDEYTASEAQSEAERCLHCDCRMTGDCRLWDWSIRLGADPGAYRKRVRNYRLDDSHPAIIFEPGKCIRCGICIQIAEAAEQRPGLSHLGRGFDGSVAPPFEGTMGDALDQETALKCADSCPTAALMRKDNR